MVESRANAGVFWVHNDSGDKPQVYAVSREGKLLGTYVLEGAAATDWEDMAIGPAPGGGYFLYMADIGDNNARRANVRIYQVREPRVDAAQAPVTQTLRGVTTHTFTYPGGARDAESFLVDPLTGDFYIVSKRDAENRLYRARPSGGGAALQQVATFPFTQSTGGEISPDGLQVLIRTYFGATYWKRANASTSLVDLLKQPGEAVSLAIEQQGEAIAFAADNRGFYTTTEREGGGSPAPAPVTFYGLAGR
jgi:hypothetical protein